MRADVRPRDPTPLLALSSFQPAIRLLCLLSVRPCVEIALHFLPSELSDKTILAGLQTLTEGPQTFSAGLQTPPSSWLYEPSVYSFDPTLR